MFEVIPANYVRKDSKKSYLQPGLDRKNFNNMLDIGSFVPKKDGCNVCTPGKLSKTNRSHEIRAVLPTDIVAHNKNRVQSRNLKARDKNRAMDITTELSAAVFDLKNTLNIGKAETNLLYYERKMSMFNYTIYD